MKNNVLRSEDHWEEQEIASWKTDPIDPKVFIEQVADLTGRLNPNKDYASMTICVITEGDLTTVHCPISGNMGLIARAIVRSIMTDEDFEKIMLTAIGSLCGEDPTYFDKIKDIANDYHKFKQNGGF